MLLCTVEWHLPSPVPPTQISHLAGSQAISRLIIEVNLKEGKEDVNYLIVVQEHLRDFLPAAYL